MSVGSFYFKLKVLLVLVVLPLSSNYGLFTAAALACCGLDLAFVGIHIFERRGNLSFYVLLSALLFLGWLVLEYVIFLNSSLVRVVQCFCIVMCYIGNSWLDAKYVNLRFVRNVIFLQLLLFVIWWPLTGFVTNYYCAIYLHSNTLAGILLGYLVILVYLQQSQKSGSKKSYYIMYAFLAFLFIVANSRSATLTVAVFLAGLLFLNCRKEQTARRRSVLLIVASMLFVAAFSIIYPQLLDTELGLQLELLSRKYLNKNFFSGREVVWKKLETIIMQSPLIGYGLDKVPNSFFTTPFSSHNLWLQTALQTGFIGIATLLLFYLNAIRFTMDQKFPQWRIAASFGAAFIVHECLEVSLTQNNLFVGMIVWFFFGLMAVGKKNSISAGNDLSVTGEYEVGK